MDGLPSRQMERGILQARKGQDSKQMLFILLSEACNIAQEGKWHLHVLPLSLRSGLREAWGHGGGVAD